MSRFSIFYSFKCNMLYISCCGAERWSAAGEEEPAVAHLWIWEFEEEKGLGFLIVLMDQPKFYPQAHCNGARELGGGHFFLATDRLMVYLFLSIDSSMLNMIIYSVRQLIAK